ncbi:YkvA family protein [Sinanaerobacter sp. ZZT-01]|uniref:YkvA family protein n=1 Tax=Sinanaerobacter sp. ZZT-01 TaxID=3111540 RepID=UPI002D79D1D7|nr:YkvA family protein [Sinanaerobacter sp. ZZT-01]WRR92708.1 YkvA family protein [Sinanaerobacter sp. ZZT-01]
MKYIVECRLRNGFNVHAIVNETVPNNAVKKACNYVKNIGREYAVIPEDCSVQKWDTKNDNNTASNRLFDYYVVDMMGQVYTGSIKGHGIKTAYNNLINKQKVNYKVVVLMDGVQNKKMRKQRGEKSTLKAKDVLKSKGQTVAVFSKAMEKSESIQGVPILREVSLMFSMVVDYMQGKYKEVPLGTIIGITAAVIYFVSPVDVIPDFIPVIGQADDVAVITWAIKHARKDLEAYAEWKNNQKTSA